MLFDPQHLTGTGRRASVRQINRPIGVNEHRRRTCQSPDDDRPRAGAQRDSIAEFWLALAYLELGRHDDAMVAALASRDEIGNAPTWIVGYAHARSGRHADALEVKRAIEAQARTMYVPATELAFLAIGLGEDDEALTWLDRGFDERSHWMELLAVHPVLDPLRDEPRFAELLHRMKLPSDAWRR